MLLELRIRDLGVIARADLVLEPGMTAVTGETGAGKTMLVEAIELLVGGRADAALVRAGAGEAWVEGRFVVEDREIVLARAVPAAGRSRAYVDGRMAPVAALAEAGAGLVDLHGQHAHQSLLATATQRAALDAFGAVDHGPLTSAKERLRSIDEALGALGGDEGSRIREIDLLRFQLAEIDAAALTDADEDAALEAEEERLADALAHRQAATVAAEALGGDGGASDAVGAALGAVARRAPLASLAERLQALVAEMAEVATDLRAAAESLEEDPERLARVRERRSLLHHLARKYAPARGQGTPGRGAPGRGSLADAIAFGEEARDRLDVLESHAERAAALEHQRGQALADLNRAGARVGEARRRAAPRLAQAVEARLRQLAMAEACLEILVGDDPGDEVTFLLGANRGEPALPLARVASGGELSRAMLAARLVLGRRRSGPTWPATVVFDEVDAGVGGQAALAVGRSLAMLAGAAVAGDGSPTGDSPSGGRQVLVVTHLSQVAAYADHQVAVHKCERAGRTMAEAQVVDGEARVLELSRMLSGQPESSAARGHAEELLAVAARERGRH
ncbi:MAG: AAA family ATPase [Actinomycetota bacterium]|nr:AAA family ATPase [Actinomycetota bacterium]